MRTIQGYKWQNVNAASGARGFVNQHFGIPKEGNTAQDYMIPCYDIDNDFYFFEGDLSPVYGKPEEFDISDNIDINPLD